MISSRIDLLMQNNIKGRFIFAGISEYGEEIFTSLDPNLKSNLFYYNCGNKFITDRLDKYFCDYGGNIIFANGEECIIYGYSDDTGKFEKKIQFKSMIPKDHKKGGQSAKRFSGIHDCIYTKYIITIIENLNKLVGNNNWIFGSQDIINEVLNRKKEITINLSNGGYLNFNNDTISDTQKWISVLSNTSIDETKFQKISELIEIGDYTLEFDPSCTNYLDQFEFILITPQHSLYSEINLPAKVIRLPENSKYYKNLYHYSCVGKYYFKEQAAKIINQENRNNDDDNDNDNFM